MPTLAELFDQALRLHRVGSYAQAESLYRQVLQLNSDHVETLSNLGVALKNQGRLAEAIQCYRKALALNPNHGNAHSNLATALVVQGHLTEAIASFQEALRINPNDANAHSNLGITFKEQGRFAEAAACYQQALRIDPGHEQALWNLSYLSLLQGDFTRGWPGYELRWAKFAMPPRIFQQPRWDGAPLRGKTILLYAEQGLGDTIQFMRYARLVKDRGGRVLFECPPALLQLFKGIDGIDRLLPQGSVLPAFDVQLPLMSLGGIFATTLTTIPGKVPYLRADLSLSRKWRAELNALEGFKIGIVWQGNPTQADDRHRSVPLAQFAPLAEVPGVRLVSLQVGPGLEQVQSAPFPIVDLGSRFDANSLDDLAAVLPNLDLVVTICTSAAHLGGALGVPAWVALRFVPHWCWLLDRPDSPWYPDLRLFRQSRPGDWGDVFQRIAAAVIV